MRAYSSFAVERSVFIREMVSFFCHLDPPGFVFTGESHNFWEFVVVLDGRAVICADDKIYHLGKGWAVWHRPGEFHSVKTDGDKTLLLGVFSFHGTVRADVTGRAFEMSDEMMKLFKSLRYEAENILEFVGRRGTLVEAIKPGKRNELSLLVSRLEYILTMSLMGDSQYPVGNPSGAEENYMRIIETIFNSISERPSIEDIASKCNMSVSNAKRVFSKYAGCGISSYCNMVTISEAKKLLHNGKSVGDVSDMLGFINRNYFSSFFRRITGFSPSEWKKRAKEIEHVYDTYD